MTPLTKALLSKCERLDMPPDLVEALAECVEALDQVDYYFRHAKLNTDEHHRYESLCDEALERLKGVAWE